MLLSLPDGEGKGINEFPLIMCMIRESVGRRSSTGGRSGLA